MQNLTVIENDLVPVYETSTGEKVVYGSELYEVLGVKSRFNDWITNRLKDCEATENEEFHSFTKNLVKGGRPQNEYIIKLDTAKEMAMLERNEKGKQVRRYFIQVEKKYRENPLDNLSTELRAVIVVDKRVTAIEGKVEGVTSRIDRLEYDIPLYGAEADELCNHVKRKGVEVMGGKKTNSYKDNGIRSAVYTDIYNQIKREFGLYDDKGRYTSYKSLRRRYIPDAHELIDCYELPTYLSEQIRDCNAQMNMEV